jgi:predicted AlkP superfamily pyrophosphatase or phosphodiesterase
MLPVPADGGSRLTAVLEGALSSLAGEGNALGLPRATSSVVVLVDGLGAANLRARAGHARFLTARMSKRDVIRTVFPSTTAAAIASLTTGVMPGDHGLVGYRVLDREHDRLVNQLNGWDERMVPEQWQPHPTLFEAAVGRGVPAYAVGAPRYAESGYTRAVLRGAEYRGAQTIGGRFAEAARILSDGPALVYLYVPELDQLAHSHGWESERWTAKLEELDGELAAFERRMPQGTGLLVTADHGVIDVPAARHVYIDARPELLEGVRHVGGEPRCLGLTFAPSMEPSERQAALERWRAAEGHRAWVMSADEAIAAGLYGPVASAARDRIADVLVAARSGIAYYDRREASRQAEEMIGQHGSMTDDEVRVPLVRAGAYAR